MSTAQRTPSSSSSPAMFAATTTTRKGRRMPSHPQQRFRGGMTTAKSQRFLWGLGTVLVGWILYSIRSDPFGNLASTTATTTIQQPWAPQDVGVLLPSFSSSSNNNMHQSSSSSSSATSLHYRVTVSPTSGRRFLASALSLPNDKSRRDRFVRAWHEAWPELHIRRQTTFRSDALTGYGCLAGHVLAMAEALEFLDHNNTTATTTTTEKEVGADYLLFLEDDALPFPNTTWPTQKAPEKTPTTTRQFNNDLDRRLDELEARHGGALFLGGGDVASPDRQQLKLHPDDNKEYPMIIAPTWWVYGTHAWIVSVHHLRGLYDWYAQTLRRYREPSVYLAADHLNHHYFYRHNISEYVAVPLLVDHSNPFSDTYQRVKKRAWDGSPEWWTKGRACMRCLQWLVAVHGPRDGLPPRNGVSIPLPDGPKQILSAVSASSTPS